MLPYRTFYAPRWRCFAWVILLVLGTVHSNAWADESTAGIDKDARSGRPSGAIGLPPEFGAASRHPGLTPILRQAFRLEDEGNCVAAISKYNEAIALGAGDASILAPTFNSIAGCYGRLERFKDEIDWATKAVTAAPNFSLGYINLGNGYAGIGDLASISQTGAVLGGGVGLDRAFGWCVGVGWLAGGRASRRARAATFGFA